MKIAHNSQELVKCLSNLKYGEEIFLIENLNEFGLPQKNVSRDEFIKIQDILRKMYILKRHTGLCFEFNYLNFGKLSINQIRIYKEGVKQ
jgi:hypothetical protein